MDPLMEIQTLCDHHIENIWNVKFHPLNPMFASCGEDKNIIIWEYSEGKEVYIKKAILSQSHKQTVRALGWDPSGTYLASASFDKSIIIWKLKEDKTFHCITSLDGHESEVKSVSWSISGSYLASCSRDKTIWIWEIDENEEFFCNSVLQGHSQDIKYVKWSPNEDILFSASFDNTIKVWGFSLIMDDWECLNTLTKHIGTVWCIDFNSKGDLFCSCSDDLSVVLWKIDLKLKDRYKNIQVVKVLAHVHNRTIYSIAFCCNDKYIVTCSSDNSIALIRGCSTENDDDDQLTVLYKKDDAHNNDVNCIDCFKKGNIIVSCGDDSVIKLWKINI